MCLFCPFPGELFREPTQCPGRERERAAHLFGDEFADVLEGPQGQAQAGGTQRGGKGQGLHHAQPEGMDRETLRERERCKGFVRRDRRNTRERAEGCFLQIIVNRGKSNIT